MVTSKCSFFSPTSTEDRMLLADSFMSTQILYFKQGITNLAVWEDLYPPIKEKKKRKIYFSINLFVFPLAIQHGRGGSLPDSRKDHQAWRRAWKQLAWSLLFQLHSSLHFSSCWSWCINYGIILLVLFLAPLLGKLILGFVLLILIYNLPSDCLK